MLNGTYYFREVAYFMSSTGSLSEDALYGTISFNGSGTYSFTSCTVYDSYYGLGTCTQFGLPTSGLYSISASGYGFLSSPISSKANVYGLVSQQGVFAGSSTENGFNDLFIAAPLATPAPTLATFKGSYWLADMDTPNGISSMFQVNPDGAGNLGNVSLTGYVYGNGSNVVTQTAAAVKYSFSNGAAVVAFPSPSNATLIAGQKYLYFSPDGNFVFGGSPTSWDFLVGIRTASGTPSFGGLYYQAGIDLSSAFDSYYGSLNANAGLAVGHQRVADVLDGYLYGYTYGEAYSVGTDGTYSNPYMRYVVGAGGVRIGSGIGPYLGINVALPAPGFSGSGVYLNPAGIVNAASSAPFTAGIAPGDFITLYGANLAPGIATAYTVPFPTTAGLNGVQVTVNGLPAPVQFVSPGQISAIVPYAIGSSSIARIQVNNNGVLSNAVTTFVNLTAPGVFTVPAGGLGYGAVLHGDYSLVTKQNPAQLGETVAVYLTGLGTTNPLIADGSAGPPSSQTNNTIQVYIGGVQATVSYSGLAPGLAGLYQVNFAVPGTVTAGDNTLEIVGPDSDAAEALIPVGTALATSAAGPAPQPAAVRRPMPPRARAK
jgi:uncharacterized protein (TIGR03437 family)